MYRMQQMMHNKTFLKVAKQEKVWSGSGKGLLDNDKEGADGATITSVEYTKEDGLSWNNYSTW